MYMNVSYIAAPWMCLKMSCTQKKPMVLLIIIPMKNGYFIGNIYHIFRQTHMDPMGYMMIITPYSISYSYDYHGIYDDYYTLFHIIFL